MAKAHARTRINLTNPNNPALVMHIKGSKLGTAANPPSGTLTFFNDGTPLLPVWSIDVTVLKANKRVKIVAMVQAHPFALKKTAQGDKHDDVDPTDIQITVDNPDDPGDPDNTTDLIPVDPVPSDPCDPNE